MNHTTSYSRRFQRVAMTCLAISALVPLSAIAGGRGTSAPLATDADYLQSQLQALDNRIAKLEKKTGEELASSDDKGDTGTAMKLGYRPLETSAAGK